MDKEDEKELQKVLLLQTLDNEYNVLYSPEEQMNILDKGWDKITADFDNGEKLGTKEYADKYSKWVRDINLFYKD